MERHKYLWWVPNFITALNLVCGSVAVFLAVQGYIGHAAILIACASVFDFLDGMMARLLHSYSELGKQLDSLCDLVSFGLAPGAIVFTLLQLALFNRQTLSFSQIINASWIEWLMLASCLLIPVAGAFRLAKFNIDTRQTTSFLGLPIPANALFFASLAAIIAWSNSELAINIVLNKFNLLVSILLFSSMMVSEIPMFSLKFKNLSWADNSLRFSYLALCLIFVASMGVIGLPLIIISYIVLSIVVKG
ncbi:MAG: CDP-alcohol phosphatidyltransferase family protein [Mangrovibacterium sp.]